MLESAVTVPGRRRPAFLLAAARAPVVAARRTPGDRSPVAVSRRGGGTRRGCGGPNGRGPLNGSRSPPGAGRGPPGTSGVGRGHPGTIGRGGSTPCRPCHQTRRRLPKRRRGPCCDAPGYGRGRGVSSGVGRTRRCRGRRAGGRYGVDNGVAPARLRALAPARPAADRRDRRGETGRGPAGVLGAASARTWKRRPRPIRAEWRPRGVGSLGAERGCSAERYGGAACGWQRDAVRRRRWGVGWPRRRGDRRAPASNAAGHRGGTVADGAGDATSPRRTARARGRPAWRGCLCRATRFCAPTERAHGRPGRP